MLNMCFICTNWLFLNLVIHNKQHLAYSALILTRIYKTQSFRKTMNSNPTKKPWHKFSCTATRTSATNTAKSVKFSQACKIWLQKNHPWSWEMSTGVPVDSFLSLQFCLNILWLWVTPIIRNSDLVYYYLQLLLLH